MAKSPAKTTSKKVTKVAPKAAPAKKVTKKTAPKPTEPSLNERVERLEAQLSTLIIVLHHNYAKDLIKGPKDLASKMRKNGLLE